MHEDFGHRLVCTCVRLRVCVRVHACTRARNCAFISMFCLQQVPVATGSSLGLHAFLVTSRKKEGASWFPLVKQRF